MRSRNIKPGFFQNEHLVELDPKVRLLFVGLWLMADRDGRLEDRPKKVKMQVFPADNWDINPMLNELAGVNLIIRYEVDSKRYISIPAWSKHQNPHVKERASTIPAPDKNSINMVPAGLIPDSLNPMPDTCTGRSATLCASDFDNWWKGYPKKVKRKSARVLWMSKKPDVEVLIADVANRIANDDQWKRGFIPHPTTYLSQERWNDEITEARHEEDNGRTGDTFEAKRARLAKRAGLD